MKGKVNKYYRVVNQFFYSYFVWKKFDRKTTENTRDKIFVYFSWLNSTFNRKFHVLEVFQTFKSASNLFGKDKYGPLITLPKFKCL